MDDHHDDQHPAEVSVRFASPSDLAATEAIEVAADSMLIEHFGATDWPPPGTAADRAAMPGFVLVAAHGDRSDRIIGFVHVLEVDGHAHLEQLSVLPQHRRRGYGRMLVSAAKDESRRRGHRSLTLRTYRDVPWNAPFYASCGFRVTTPATPFLRSLVEVEARLGLEHHGARVEMTAGL